MLKTMFQYAKELDGNKHFGEKARDCVAYVHDMMAQRSQWWLSESERQGVNMLLMHLMAIKNQPMRKPPPIDFAQHVPAEWLKRRRRT
ncbi:hypothetical protein [Alsobacter sp. R-9]